MQGNPDTDAYMTAFCLIAMQEAATWCSVEVQVSITEGHCSVHCYLLFLLVTVVGDVGGKYDVKTWRRLFGVNIKLAFLLCYSVGTLKVVTSNGCSKSISLAPVSFLLGHRACQRPEGELCPTLKGTWKASPPRMLLLWPRMRSPMRTSLTGTSFTNLFPEVCIKTLSVPVNNLSSGLWVLWANELFSTNQSTAELIHMHMHVEPLMVWFWKQTKKSF